MADFEAIIRKHVDNDGNIPTTAINAIVTAIKAAVGNEFVDKERYKAKLSEIDRLKEEKHTAEDNATTAEKWKDKHDALKSEFEQYKKDITARETKTAKQDAYKAVLKAVDIPDKWLERVMKGVDFDTVELNDKGEIKSADELKETIKKEWADVIGTVGKSGADTNNPPGNNGSPNQFGDIRSMTAKWHAAKYGETPNENNN